MRLRTCSDISCTCLFLFQDGRIDYNEFVAMMQKGDNDTGKRRLQSNFSMGFREALPVY